MTRPAIVFKFGGVTLATPARIRRAAARLAAWRRAGHPVIAVVSACGSSTDSILRLAERVDGTWEGAGRELDRALATGELLASSLVATALLALGVPARGLSGGEAGIIATGPHGGGRVERVEADFLNALIVQGVVPVVAGFQGRRADGETVTLGRNTSDLTAVHLAAALRAGECRLIKDVAGVYDRDPRLHPDARLLSRLDYGDLERITGACDLVHPAASRLAERRRVPLRVYDYRAPLLGDHGTSITVQSATPILAVSHA